MLRWLRRRSAAPPPPAAAVRAEAPLDLLVVGLGNPGPDYEGTRHNVGFAVAERVAEALGVARPVPGAGPGGWADAGPALVAEGVWRGRRVAVAKPTTFMNRSGRALTALLRRYGLGAERALVVYDDLALPLGALRLREAGSAGGHNGLQDVLDALGTDAVARLRVGIGGDFGRGAQVAFVLAPFDAAEQAAAEEAVSAAAEAVLAVAEAGVAAAASRHNRKRGPGSDGAGGGIAGGGAGGASEGPAEGR